MTIYQTRVVYFEVILLLILVIFWVFFTQIDVPEADFPLILQILMQIRRQIVGFLTLI